MVRIFVINHKWIIATVFSVWRRNNLKFRFSIFREFRILMVHKFVFTTLFFSSHEKNSLKKKHNFECAREKEGEKSLKCFVINYSRKKKLMVESAFCFLNARTVYIIIEIDGYFVLTDYFLTLKSHRNAMYRIIACCLNK